MKSYEKKLHFRNLIFQQDDASVHKAKFVNIFLKEAQYLLEWSANSTDLNPIENLWATMEQELRKPRVLQEKLAEKSSKP